MVVNCCPLECFCIICVFSAFLANPTKLQDRAPGILTFKYDANTGNHLLSLGWKKLKSQRIINAATVVNKSLNGLAPNHCVLGSLPCEQRPFLRPRGRDLPLPDLSGKIEGPQFARYWFIDCGDTIMINIIIIMNYFRAFPDGSIVPNMPFLFHKQ